MLNSAGLEWYKTGKVAVTNGSTKVTGTDTAWTSTGIKKGDIFTIDDTRKYEIASVDSNTSITLVKAYAGSTASGQSYGIIRNFAATVTSELAADLTELFRIHKTTIDETLAKIQGLKGDPGLYYKGDWTSGTTYEALDVVLYTGKMYLAKVNHVSSSDNAPLATNTAWQDMALTVPTGADVFNYNNAGLHNSIFRGKNLGTSFTGAQSAEIKAGTYKELWVGDFWQANNVAYSYTDASGNVVNDTYSNEFIVARCQHNGELVIVPRNELFKMSLGSNMSGGYKSCDFRTKSYGAARAQAMIEAFFGASHVVAHNLTISSAANDDGVTGISWVTSKVELMSEVMVFGNFAHSYNNVGHICVPSFQLDLFKFYDEYRERHNFWLQNTINKQKQSFAYAALYGLISNSDDCTQEYGIRPYALIA